VLFHLDVVRSWIVLLDVFNLDVGVISTALLAGLTTFRENLRATTNRVRLR
jgi:hypothetical protein